MKQTDDVSTVDFNMFIRHSINSEYPAIENVYFEYLEGQFQFVWLSDPVHTVQDEIGTGTYK